LATQLLNHCTRPTPRKQGSEQQREVHDPATPQRKPLPLSTIEAAFKGKGLWNKSLPRLLDTLEVLGRARQSDRLVNKRA
jgi:hypothetical protein